MLNHFFEKAQSGPPLCRGASRGGAADIHFSFIHSLPSFLLFIFLFTLPGDPQITKSEPTKGREQLTPLICTSYRRAIIEQLNIFNCSSGVNCKPSL